MRCAFCGHLCRTPYPEKTPGVHSLTCIRCRRMFIVVVEKHWWGFRRHAHVR